MNISKCIPDDHNPYAAPIAKLKAPEPSPGETYLGLFLTWEKLRLVFNSILAVETMTLMMLFPPRRMNVSILVVVAVAWFVANVCFCLGPVLNGYAYWIGFRHPAVATGLFVAGMILSALLAAVVVVNLHVPRVRADLRTSSHEILMNNRSEIGPTLGGGRRLG
jgi:hypothetical protein